MKAMKKGLFLICLLLSLPGLASSMNCRVTEMIDHGMWAGFQKKQVDFDSNLVSFVTAEFGSSLNINLKKILESHQGTTLILKSSVASEKIELVITPLKDSINNFKIVLTQLTRRSAVVAHKEMVISSGTPNVARMAIDGNGKQTILECEISPI